MNLCVRLVRGLALSCAVLSGILVGAGCLTVGSSGVAFAQTVNSIAVEGSRRVEADTIRSYFHAGPNGQLSPSDLDDGLKALYATGLFSDVHINRAGGRIVVSVVENPVINKVAFEGNKKAKDDQLSAEVQSKPRGTLSKPTDACASSEFVLTPSIPVRWPRRWPGTCRDPISPNSANTRWPIAPHAENQPTATWTSPRRNTARPLRCGLR